MLTQASDRVSHKVRWVISGAVLKIPRYGQKLNERTTFTEVGCISGHVTDLDTVYAKAKGLHKLNRFEKWLMEPRIERQKSINWARYRTTVIDVTGEDPNERYPEEDFHDNAFELMANAILTDRIKQALSPE